jgi:hypothetical protein
MRCFLHLDLMRRSFFKMAAATAEGTPTGLQAIAAKSRWPSILLILADDMSFPA